MSEFQAQAEVVCFFRDLPYYGEDRFVTVKIGYRCGDIRRGLERHFQCEELRSFEHPVVPKYEYLMLGVVSEIMADAEKHLQWVPDEMLREYRVRAEVLARAMYDAREAYEYVGYDGFAAHFCLACIRRFRDLDEAIRRNGKPW